MTQSRTIPLVLNEGKNREIRRMLARLEHKVLRLRRVVLGPITGTLPGGRARRLRADEIAALRQTAKRLMDEKPTSS